jgi:metal-responsive CopG/Arc/MetJ family transcriptional regulator
MSRMVAVRLDEALLRDVDKERRREAMSRASVVKDALRLWVERRRLKEAVDGHRAAYVEAPPGEGEFEPILGAQRWPK